MCFFENMDSLVRKIKFLVSVLHVPLDNVLSLLETLGCYERSKRGFTDEDGMRHGTIGSTNNLPMDTSHEKFNGLGGIFSDEKDKNPTFHNWNIVFLVYCDGFCFSGDRLVFNACMYM